MFNRKFSMMTDEIFASYINDAAKAFNNNSSCESLKKDFKKYPNHDLIAADDDGVTALHHLAESGDIDCLRLLLNIIDVNVNAIRRSDRRTPLIIASNCNHYNAVGAFLNIVNIDVNSRDNIGGTALHYALLHNFNIIALALIEDHRINVNLSCDAGNTPLHYAAKFGCIDGALALIKKGADVARVNNEGDTPLIVAAKNGHASIADALQVIEGIDLTFLNKEGHTASWYAKQSNHQGMVTLAARLAEVEPAKALEKITKTFLQRLKDITFTGEYPEDLIDPILNELFEDPVTIAGHTYERNHLLKMFEDTHSSSIKAPINKKTITLTEVLNTDTNYNIKAMVEKFVSREEKLYKDKNNITTTVVQMTGPKLFDSSERVISTTQDTTLLSCDTSASTCEANRMR